VDQFDLPRILLVGVAALTVAACGSTAASSSRPAAGSTGGNNVAGQVAQLSGSKLAVGQCIRATGQKDSSGTIKARTLSIQPAGPTGCFSGGPGGGGFGPGRRGGSPSPSTSTA